MTVSLSRHLCPSLIVEGNAESDKHSSLLRYKITITAVKKFYEMVASWGLYHKTYAFYQYCRIVNGNPSLIFEGNARAY
jgi:hypothetical protein